MKGEWLKRKLKTLPDRIEKKRYERRRAAANRRLRDRSFSIISNNCWAGSVYRYFDMPYLTPTVGLYFFSPEYIKFVSNLRYYLGMELEFIDCTDSRYKDEIAARGQQDKPIGRLGDVEIVFLHYKTREEAKDKWDRRKARINFDDIILKFSKINLCTDKELEAFDALDFKKKFMFVNDKKHGYKCGKYFSGYDGKDEIELDLKPFPKNIKIVNLLNKPSEKYS